MSSPLVVVVFVALGEASDPSALALSSAVREVLGADAVVDVREREAPASDDDARADAALADVRWLDVEHTRAHLRVLPAPGARWIEREITFALADAPNERGRTLGLAIASALPPPPPPSPEPPREAPIVAAPAPAVVEDTLDAAVYAGGLASAPIAGHGAGYGGVIAAEVDAGAGFALRAAFSLRFGEVERAQATLLALTAGAGVRYTLLAPGDDLPFGVAARADVFAAHQSLGRFAPAGRERRSHWLPGADLAAEAAIPVGASTELVLTAGAEAFFGRATVFARAEEVATLPPVRGLLELGLRARF